jgi:class 3 adenylate cyclase/predicted ATPase
MDAVPKIEATAAYIPADWRQAIASGKTLSERTRGTALFADVSGFTSLTGALTRALGLRGGAEELPRHLNMVFDALIAEVDRYGGSVIGFAGDAITCWFADGERPDLQWQDPAPLEAPRRAVACAMAMQTAMAQFAAVPVPGQDPVPLAIKVALASGPARRFLVGDPKIQLIPTLAGETLLRMAAAEHLAGRGEVVVDGQTAAAVAECARVVEWRAPHDGGLGPGDDRFAVVGGLRCDVAPLPWPPLDPGALGEDQVRPWMLPAVCTRLRAGLGDFLTELRPAVALFLRFSGIDYDGDEQAGTKLDAYVRWLQRIIARYDGTLIHIAMGDKGSYLCVAFGAPIAHEDDAQRAVTTALEMRNVPSDMDFVHQVQVGVSQGTMRTGAYGGATRRTYGVFGDEANLAARLMQHAPPGEALISRRVQRLVGGAFVFEDLPPIQVKGNAEPVPVARLVGVRESNSERVGWLRSQAGPLVGRDAELAELQVVLDRARAGEGQIVRLEGGRGMGESRLAVAFARRAAGQGVRVCVGACQSTTRHILYAPWRPIFADLLALDEGAAEARGAGQPDDGAMADPVQQMARLEAAVDRINPGWRVRLPLLGDLLNLPIPDNATTGAFDPRLRQEALFTLAVELVQAEARTEPLFLLVKDVHWMDEASLGLTLALARVASQLPLVLLLVQRPPLDEDARLLPDLNHLPSYHHLTLGELAPVAINAIVAARLGVPLNAVSRLALALIQSQAQGTAYFAESLVDALRETEDLVLRDSIWVLSGQFVDALREANCLEKDPDSGQWRLCPDAPLAGVSLGIPDSVHGIVLSRLDRLPEAHKMTLKVASVIGRVFELDLLRRAHPSSPDDEGLQAQQEVLEQRDFVRTEVPSQRYTFTNNVVQEVAYGTLTDSQQRGLHTAVGVSLEALRASEVERLAYHFVRGGDAVRDRAMCYLDRAAGKARREFANETALNYYNQALALEERWSWRQGQIQTLHSLGRREEELAALHVLEGLPGALASDVAYLWGEYYEAISAYAQARSAIERALDQAAFQVGASPVAEIDCLSQLGLIARREGDYEQAKDWYQQALALFRSEAAYAPEEAGAFARALTGLGFVHRQQGDYDQARIRYQQALDLNRQSGNRRGEADSLFGLATTAYYQRRFAEELEYLKQTIRIQRTIGDRAGEAVSLMSMAQVNVLVGHYDQAEKWFHSALSIHQALGNRWEESNVWNGLGVLYLEMGDLTRAQQSLDTGLALCQAIGDEAGEPYMLCNLGLIARDRCDFDAARDLLDRGLVMARVQEDKFLIAVFVSYLSTVSLAVGDAGQAIEEAGAALALRQELGLDLLVADDHTVLAAAHQRSRPPDGVQALEHARQAMAILDGCDGEGPEFPQRDYYLCYQVLAAHGQMEAAQAALSSAHRLVETRAAKIGDPALHRSFLENVPVNRQIVQEMERE